VPFPKRALLPRPIASTVDSSSLSPSRALKRRIQRGGETLIVHRSGKVVATELTPARTVEPEPREPRRWVRVALERHDQRRKIVERELGARPERESRASWGPAWREREGEPDRLRRQGDRHCGSRCGSWSAPKSGRSRRFLRGGRLGYMRLRRCNERESARCHARVHGRRIERCGLVRICVQWRGCRVVLRESRRGRALRWGRIAGHDLRLRWLRSKLDLGRDDWRDSRLFAADQGWRARRFSKAFCDGARTSS